MAEQPQEPALPPAQSYLGEKLALLSQFFTRRRRRASAPVVVPPATELVGAAPIEAPGSEGPMTSIVCAREPEQAQAQPPKKQRRWSLRRRGRGQQQQAPQPLPPPPPPLTGGRPPSPSPGGAASVPLGVLGSTVERALHGAADAPGPVHDAAAAALHPAPHRTLGEVSASRP